MSFSWQGRRVLVTGGASFIGSHLVDALIARRAWVRVVDDLSSGSEANIEAHLSSPPDPLSLREAHLSSPPDPLSLRERGDVAGHFQFEHADLREPGVARRSMRGINTVFHLAADHGGRGYVDLHQAGPAGNLLLDGIVFREAHLAGVERVVFASSGCVYPNFLQGDPAKEIYLTEELVRAPYDADNMYGWAKLMGELTLKAFAAEYGIKTASCRYFTVYGPRAKENHAVLAMIARAVTRQDPFEVWGSGEQIRNWTYVDDIVTGTIAAAERIEDGTAVNLGTMERVRVRDAARIIMELTGHDAAILLRPEMPTGPLNRVADNGLAKQLLDWEPAFSFAEGLERTIAWYRASRTPDEAARILEGGGLIEKRAG